MNQPFTLSMLSNESMLKISANERLKAGCEWMINEANKHIAEFNSSEWRCLHVEIDNLCFDVPKHARIAPIKHKLARRVNKAQWFCKNERARVDMFILQALYPNSSKLEFIMDKLLHYLDPNDHFPEPGHMPELYSLITANEAPVSSIYDVNCQIQAEAAGDYRLITPNQNPDAAIEAAESSGLSAQEIAELLRASYAMTNCPSTRDSSDDSAHDGSEEDQPQSQPQISAALPDAVMTEPQQARQTGGTNSSHTWSGGNEFQQQTTTNDHVFEALPMQHKTAQEQTAQWVNMHGTNSDSQCHTGTPRLYRSFNVSELIGGFGDDPLAAGSLMNPDRYPPMGASSSTNIPLQYGFDLGSQQYQPLSDTPTLLDPTRYNTPVEVMKTEQDESFWMNSAMQMGDMLAGPVTPSAPIVATIPNTPDGPERNLYRAVRQEVANYEEQIAYHQQQIVLLEKQLADGQQMMQQIVDNIMNRDY